MTLNIQTFGCRLNTYESEVMRAHAQDAGLEDAIIINTCAVTKEAERQARQAIRKARRTNPDAKLIVTGCAAQVKPDDFAAMDEVDVVLGNQEKLEADTWNTVSDMKEASRPNEPSASGAPPIAEVSRPELEGQSKILLNDIMEVRETASHLVSGFEGQTRAFVQVQNGCNHRCTFCIIPYGRGNSRSVPMGEVVQQVKRLVEQGYKEIVFTGVDISAYGEDLPGTPTLGSLVRRTLRAVPELPRLRLSSIDAVEIDEQLWEAVASEERLMPHLHLSLQAGDDMVLKRMKRRHLRDDILTFTERARRLRPDTVFGADIIAGFPTETDAMFENTLNIVKEAGLTWLHVFPYSERDGTPAAKMPQVPHPIRKERAARLREAGAKQEQAFLTSRIGTTAQVLMEKDGLGRTEHFAPVRVGEGHEAGSLVNETISGLQYGALIAHIGA